MASGLDQLDDRMVVVACPALAVDRRASGFGKDPPRRGMGEARLADALGSREQPGMMQLARRPGCRELLDGSILPDNHGNRSAMASSSRCVTSSGAPEASTSLTRSGSSAAMMWNAASTLR